MRLRSQISEWTNFSVFYIRSIMLCHYYYYRLHFCHFFLYNSVSCSTSYPFRCIEFCNTEKRKEIFPFTFVSFSPEPPHHHFQSLNWLRFLFAFTIHTYPIQDDKKSCRVIKNITKMCETTVTMEAERGNQVKREEMRHIINVELKASTSW